MKKRKSLRKRLCKKLEAVEYLVGWNIISATIIALSIYHNWETKRGNRRTRSTIDF